MRLTIKPILICSLLIGLCFTHIWGQKHNFNARVYNIGTNNAWLDSLKLKDTTQWHHHNIEEITAVDFSELWLQDTAGLTGSIGSSNQVMTVKYLSIIRNSERPNIYYIHGVTQVNQTVSYFQGTIDIVQYYSATPNNDMGFILANCDFHEKDDGQHSGSFRGVIKTNFYLNKALKVAINLPISSNFKGYWTDYRAKKGLIVNW